MDKNSPYASTSSKNGDVHWVRTVVLYTTQVCLSSESSTLVPPTQLDTAGRMFKVNDVHSELAHSLTLLIRSHLKSTPRAPDGHLACQAVNSSIQ
ncbi:uncharacterized protein ARMOST_14014 [Armillaria ostoyae]|uniref:Uncharacterized protein n=1 Tax=Armillaria ostoyae TaxID=47428 RepID=A0A284RPF9_ARMOS|nr:uncharacterized protein ARMOST_14014 [Armillaria ostoyae]